MLGLPVLGLQHGEQFQVLLVSAVSKLGLLGQSSCNVSSVHVPWSAYFYSINTRVSHKSSNN